MSFSPDIIEVINELPSEAESNNFIIRYGFRNPPSGPGLGGDGVRDQILILTYFQALESLYRVMTSPPWNRRCPIVGDLKKTLVYVCDSPPFTAYDDNKVPCIVLPSRSSEPTTNAELRRAAAEAVHEATHLFNFTHRPHYETSSKPWIWFDEGMAVLLETLVVAGNPDYFRFMMNWIDMPEMPLDDPMGKYQAGMFVRYLYMRMGVEFVNEVWTKSSVGIGPLDALAHFAALKNETFISADPTVEDIFASGYCIDPYFMCDHTGVGLAPDLFFRFGERAISQTLVLDPITDSEIEVKDFLDHLSCRYYRIYLKNDVKQLSVRMSFNQPCVRRIFKAEIATVTKHKMRSSVTRLHEEIAQDPDGCCHLNATLTGLDAGKIDHLLLVVSNCGVRSSANNIEHDDDKIYTIKVKAS